MLMRHERLTLSRTFLYRGIDFSNDNTMKTFNHTLQILMCASGGMTGQIRRWMNKTVKFLQMIWRIMLRLFLLFRNFYRLCSLHFPRVSSTKFENSEKQQILTDFVKHETKYRYTPFFLTSWSKPCCYFKHFFHASQHLQLHHGSPRKVFGHKPPTHKSPCIDMPFIEQYCFQKIFTVKFTESYSLKMKAKLFYSKHLNYLQQ